VKTVRSNAPPYKDTPQVKVLSVRHEICTTQPDIFAFLQAKAAKPFALEDIVPQVDLPSFSVKILAKLTRLAQPQMLCDGNLGERQESLCLSSSEEVLVPDQKPKNM